jgi:transketolase C-terminal domain/subunit
MDALIVNKVKASIESVEAILKENKDVGLIDLYKFKPINKKILNFLKNYKKIISIEEQWLEGGMGSKLLELLNDENLNINIKRYGLDERFYFENGGRDYLHKNYGLDIDKILSDL